MIRRVAAAAALLATLLSGLAALLIAAPAGAPALPLGPAVARAANGVDVRGSTTYTVDPDSRVVNVSALVTIRNVRPASSTQRFFFSSYTLGVHATAQEVHAIHDGRELAVTTAPKESATGQPYVEVRVTFHRLVFYGETYAFRLDYQLPDGGARSPVAVRVGQAFGSFYAYAFGEEGAEVRIVFPKGFELITRRGALLAPSAGPDGSVVLAASGIGKPADWWVYVGAERPSALRTEALTLELDGARHRIEVKSWPEDRHWARIVHDRLSRGLPLMASLIGLPWPTDETLEVSEVYSPLLGGYAGIFYKSTDEIRITEAANELIVLHEVSHAWFDGALVSGRWINEGLADEYAALTLARLGGRAAEPDEVDRADPVAFPLNAWADPAPASDPTAEAMEAYGYNASWSLIRQLVEEIGDEGMRNVFAAARARTIAYQGEGPAEPLPADGVSADWRVLLDLLEERGGSQAASQLFEQWVATPQELPVLEARQQARSIYRELVAHGRTWAAPLPIRQDLALWRFADATQQMATAEALLVQRDRIERLSNAIGAEPTGTLEKAYEGAIDPDGFARAKLLAEDQLRTLVAISGAAELLARDHDPFTSLGLLSEAPGAALAEARRQFEHDDLLASRGSAERAVQLLHDAPARGRERVLLFSIAVALAFALLVTLGVRLGRRRRQALATMSAASGKRPPSA